MKTLSPFIFLILLILFGFLFHPLTKRTLNPKFLTNSTLQDALWIYGRPDMIFRYNSETTLVYLVGSQDIFCLHLNELKIEHVENMKLGVLFTPRYKSNTYGQLGSDDAEASIFKMHVRDFLHVCFRFNEIQGLDFLRKLRK